jgi:hypothetical protein
LDTAPPNENTIGGLASGAETEDVTVVAAAIVLAGVEVVVGLVAEVGKDDREIFAVEDGANVDTGATEVVTVTGIAVD